MILGVPMMKSGAVEENKIAPARYKSYLNMLGE